jgi:hypothetical protein
MALTMHSRVVIIAVVALLKKRLGVHFAECCSLSSPIITQLHAQQSWNGHQNQQQRRQVHLYVSWLANPHGEDPPSLARRNETEGISFVTTTAFPVATSMGGPILKEARVGVSPSQQTDELRMPIDFDAVYILFASAFIGVLSGFSVAMFQLSIEQIRNLMDGTSLGEHFPVALIPAVGGLGVAFLASIGKFTPGLRGTAMEIDAMSINSSEDLRFERGSAL